VKGDFSRLRFDPDQRDESWLLQQGRIGLDSDHNEAELARLHDLELRTSDTIGGCARPDPGTGFRVTPGPDDDFVIGGGPGPAGHLYVDGLLCRNPQPTTYLHQPQYPDPDPLPLPQPAQAGWRVTGSLSVARAGHTATTLHDGSVLVTGGSTGGTPTPIAERYDAASGTWSRTGSMAVARMDHAAVLLADGRVLVAGGRSSGGIALASAEVYDPAIGTWSATGSLAAARTRHSMSLLVSGKVLAVGGADLTIVTAGGTPTETALASAEQYDPAAGAWTAIASMTDPRAGHTAVRLTGQGSDQLLAVGGEAAGVALASVELYDVTARTWNAVQALGEARTGHAATRLPDGTVLVTGGSGAAGILASAELYRPAAARWDTVSSMSGPRVYHTATLLSQGQLLVAGGFDANGPLRSAEIWDGQVGTWTQTRSMSEARGLHTAVLRPDHRVLVTGGAARPRIGDVIRGAEIPSAELYDPGESAFAVAYVDGWRRLVTYLQDDFREVALRGPDTTVRLRTIAQVKVAPVPLTHRPAALDCDHARGYLPRPSGGRLSTVIDNTLPAGSECELPDPGGYTGRDNRLYRVEVHTSGEILGAPPPPDLLLQFDAPVGTQAIALTDLTVAQAALLGRGRWDISDSTGATAEALLIDGVDVAGRTVTLSAALRNSYAVSTGARLSRARNQIRLAGPVTAGQTKLTITPAAGLPSDTTFGGLGRSWYLRGGNRFEPVTVTHADPATGVVTLAGPLANGYPQDSELLPRARFKWSRDNAAFAVAVTAVQQVDIATPRMVLEVDSLGRDQASALRMGDLVELIGEADDLGPGTGLLCRVATDPDPDLLLVTVDAADPSLNPATGAGTVPDHLVLRRWDGADFVAPGPVDLGDGVGLAFTGGDFHAGDYWWFTTRVDGGLVEELTNAQPAGPVHRLAPLAVLGWASDPKRPGKLRLQARDCVPSFDPLNGLTAARVAYDDQANRLGVSTVQEAIDVLGARPRWPVIADGGINWENDRPLPLSALNQGLAITFSEPMDRATFGDATVQIWLELPLFFRRTVPTHLPVRLAGTVSCDGQTCTFVPDPQIDAADLETYWAEEDAISPGSPGLRTRVTLKSGMLLDAAGQRPLDGAVTGRSITSGTASFLRLRLPSGNGVPGGDFESWFYLARPQQAAQVQAVDPPDGMELDHFPPVILAIFSGDVRAESVTGNSFTVTDAAGQPVPGEVQPYPFTPGAALISRATFIGGSRTQDAGGRYTVRLFGSGAHPILDAAGNRITDFSTSFTVTRLART
jgi:hypothetical protein